MKTSRARQNLWDGMAYTVTLAWRNTFICLVTGECKGSCHTVPDGFSLMLASVAGAVFTTSITYYYVSKRTMAPPHAIRTTSDEFFERLFEKLTEASVFVWAKLAQLFTEALAFWLLTLCLGSDKV